MRESESRHRPVGYESALERERLRFENCVRVHDLPDIFHYWSETHLKPQCLPFGFTSPNALFAKVLEELYSASPHGSPKRFVSIGAGNCDLEIEIALHLRASGCDSFEIDCLDLNSAMLERGRALASRSGLTQHFSFLEADFNRWEPATAYDAVIANQSLHHVLNLEGLFEGIRCALKPGGAFVISDMIGRNGHQRWPEALHQVHEFWRRLPPSYRMNLRTGLYEEMYVDRDCALEEFEGIRSQDILPLLLGRFHFQLFLPFGNVIDPFVDRSFGHRFNAAAAWDRAFIGEIHQCDEAGLHAGILSPTHMLAVVANEPAGRIVQRDNLSPEFCLRKQQRVSYAPGASAITAYHRDAWTRDPARELEIVCRHLAKSAAAALCDHEELTRRTLWAQRLERELDEQTAWALRLQAELDEYRSVVRQLEQQLEDRTAWALALRSEVANQDEVAAWANRLCTELEFEKRRAAQLEAELLGYLRNPLRYFRRLCGKAFARMRRVLARRACSGRAASEDAPGLDRNLVQPPAI